MPVIMPFVAHERMPIVIGFRRVCSSITFSHLHHCSPVSPLTPNSNIPHRKDNAVDIEEWHQWLGLAVRNIAAAWCVLLVARPTLRTLGGWNIFMSSGAIGSKMSIVDSREHRDSGGRSHVLVAVFIDHVLNAIWLM